MEFNIEEVGYVAKERTRKENEAKKEAREAVVAAWRKMTTAQSFVVPIETLGGLSIAQVRELLTEEEKPTYRTEKIYGDKDGNQVVTGNRIFKLEPKLKKTDAGTASATGEGQSESAV